MARRSKVIDGLAVAFGFTPMSVEVIVRFLTPQGLVPTVRRGQRALHYNAEQIKNVLLGASAVQATRSAEAAIALDGLRARGPNQLLSFGIGEEITSTVEPGTTFGRWLQSKIENLAANKAERDSILATAQSQPPSLRITMSPEEARGTPHASVWHSGERSMSTFNPERQLVPFQIHHARRTFEIDEVVLAYAAELLADSWAKQASPTPSASPRGGKAGTADPKKKKAAEPASSDGLHSMGATRYRAKTALLNKVQSKEKSGTKQPSPDGSGSNSRAGSPSKFERKPS